MEDSNLKITHNLQTQDQLFGKVVNIIDSGRQEATSAAYNAMTKSYYLIGKSIIEEEQFGNIRAEYGKAVLSDLSKKLTARYGRGFSIRSLQEFKSFYIYIQNTQTLSAQLQFPLSYSIYTIISDITEPQKTFYELLAIKEKMTVRTLKQAIKTNTYERYITKEKAVLVENGEPQTGNRLSNPISKDPILLDFLGLRKDEQFLEKELENRIIRNLEKFLLEIGNGFAFIGRQSRISISGTSYFLDLVFYHAILKCYVIIDLKRGTFSHEHVGQMLMYVNYYDSEIKQENDNPTVGIILCSDKDKNIVDFTLQKNPNIYATKYLTYLPTKEELLEIVEGEIEEYNKEKNEEKLLAS
jgi:predicted nuclease of restriction endonuclease-like (RecB) superfamily